MISSLKFKNVSERNKILKIFCIEVGCLEYRFLISQNIIRRRIVLRFWDNVKIVIFEKFENERFKFKLSP